ncbi:MAG: hypothetical protein Q8N42_01385 [bacterium]|nr:hypothetical protein [bacterium]
MGPENYVNIEYVFYQFFLFIKESYFFIINMPWASVYFWGRIISAIIVFLFTVGIIYNLTGIAHLKPKEREEF